MINQKKNSNLGFNFSFTNFPFSILYSLFSIHFKKGFSLIELLIGMVIFSMISLMIGAVYLSHFRLFTNQNAQIEIANQNKIALDEIVNQIREAKSVSYACQSPACSPSEYPSATKLIICLWPLNASGEPFDPLGSCQGNGSNMDLVIYYCASTCPTAGTTTNLMKKVIPTTASTRQASTDIVISKVKDLNFKYYAPDNTPICATPCSPYFYPITGQVLITLTTQSSTFTQTQPHTVTQSAKAILRNFNL